MRVLRNCPLSDSQRRRYDEIRARYQIYRETRRGFHSSQTPNNRTLIRSGEARLVGWSRQMLYSGFSILPRSVIRSASSIDRSDNLDVIHLMLKLLNFRIRTLFVVTAISAVATAWCVDVNRRNAPRFLHVYLLRGAEKLAIESVKIHPNAEFLLVMCLKTGSAESSNTNLGLDHHYSSKHTAALSPGTFGLRN